jgi:hypothetical protein
VNVVLVSTYDLGASLSAGVAGGLAAPRRARRRGDRSVAQKLRAMRSRRELIAFYLPMHTRRGWRCR